MIPYRKKFRGFVLGVAAIVALLVLIGTFAVVMWGARGMSCARLGALCDSFGFYAYLSGVGV